MKVIWFGRAVLVGATVLLISGNRAMAQSGGGMPPGGAGARDSGFQGGPGEGNRPPRQPLELALDANGDGVIGADEIANAAAALKTLDKNGDGKLTEDEYRPPRPDGRGGGNRERQRGSSSSPQEPRDKNGFTR